ncbi:hypothetical protein SKAU_G00166780 [Synaphobranchus kaupii]|uniref:Uncharacterized protein n=1 Tax=Synaphobranchus kaupii TaxID=118154 RepID=A0A9Q1IZZ1_SYNKA|nr:hypothetical protein SKAU_G00166780 [Synaphobranchus kaupii]
MNSNLSEVLKGAAWFIRLFHLSALPLERALQRRGALLFRLAVGRSSTAETGSASAIFLLAATLKYSGGCGRGSLFRAECSRRGVSPVCR